MDEKVKEDLLGYKLSLGLEIILSRHRAEKQSTGKKKKNHFSRAGEPENFFAAPAPDFFFKRLRDFFHERLQLRLQGSKVQLQKYMKQVKLSI